MADDKSIKGPQDSARVNMNEDYEVRYWTNKFNGSKEEPERAVKNAGSSSKAVEEFLKNNRQN